jgi:two-component system, OmpR family, alkaline phosphatase synthesis response regulator PhoP
VEEAMAKRILIADDEPNIVVSLEFLMKQRGYEIRVASNGAEALEAVGEFRPDLILLDVMMPRVSGYDVCQKVRENPEWQGIKIIMLSAKGRDVEVTKGIAIGADAYVTKPFSTRDLIAKVGEMLGE